MFGWKPGIGDPTIYGWVTVAAYAVAAGCCWWASRRAPSSERRFWLLVTVVMVLLCINKQLDLQELITDVGRVEAKAHGWYAERHEYQIGLIAVLAAASLIAMIVLLRRAARASGPLRGAIVGLALLLLFVLVRASSFHKVDWFINLRLAGIRANHVMELGGIAIVAAFALAAGRTRNKRRPASV